MSFDLLVCGRALIDGAFRDAAIGVRAGRIATIDVDADAPGEIATEIVDLAPDEVLLSGLVDTHVHINEPGRTEWEGFVTAIVVAAVGGVTIVLDMSLNSIPPTTTVENLRVKQ